MATKKDQQIGERAKRALEGRALNREDIPLNEGDISALTHREEQIGMVITAQAFKDNILVLDATQNYTPIAARPLMLRAMTPQMVMEAVSLLKRHWNTKDYLEAQGHDPDQNAAQIGAELQGFERFAAAINRSDMRTAFRDAIMPVNRAPSEIQKWKSGNCPNVAALLKYNPDK